MTLRPPAPGPQLSTGRLRVDAGRAIAKLREYQLADRSAWILEAIRAAVASGATRIELSGDANDVWLGWTGPAWPADVLPRLFDELVSPEPDATRHHVRLLAAAINSALGMNPAYVDVLAIGETIATSVRYTPDVLVDHGELGDSPLREVEAQTFARREPATGMRIHLRRRVGLDLLAYWLGEPPELPLARRACGDLAVPLHVGDQVYSRDHGRDVVRIALGQGLDGFVAVTEPETDELGFLTRRAGDDARPEAILEVAERGVVLARYHLDLIGPVVGPVPLRVLIDAPRMPTNASRSQVRRDAYPIANAERRAAELVPDVIAALAKRTDETGRRAALALLAARIAGAGWNVGARQAGVLSPLAQLPLLTNAVGASRPVASIWRSEVHTGGKPYDEDLTPWLHDMLWAPPETPSSWLLGRWPVDKRAARRFARWARRQRRAHAKFYNHEQRDARVRSTRTPRARAQLEKFPKTTCIRREWLLGLSGEVCVYSNGDIGTLSVLLDGRELEHVEFDSPIAFDAVIESKKVRPGDRYRGVNRDSEYSRIERAMRAGIVLALEALAPDAEIGDAPLFRAGFDVVAELGLKVAEPLLGVRAFPGVDGSWHSLADLAKLPTIGIAPSAEVCVPRGRLVLALRDGGRDALVHNLDSRLVRYDRYARTTLDAHATRLANTAGCALIVRDEDVSGVIAPGTSTLHLCHVGIELEVRPYAAQLMRCEILVDGDAIVPDERWSKIADDAGLRTKVYVGWEIALVRAIAGYFIGAQPPELVVAQLTLGSLIGRLFAQAICAAPDPAELLGGELLYKLTRRALFQQLGRKQISIEELASEFPAEIPYIPAAQPAVHGFAPVVAEKFLADMIGKLAGRDVVDATDELERRQRISRREARLARHREQPQVPLSLPGNVLQVPLGTDGSVAAGSSSCEVRVLVERRPFTVMHPDLDLPLLAVIDVAADHCDDSFEELLELAELDIERRVKREVPALLLAHAKADPCSLADPGVVRELLVDWLDEAGADDALREQLAKTPAFPTVQGARVSLAEAAEPRGALQIAAWQGTWLTPLADEAADALDAPTLCIPTANPELRRVVDALHLGAVVDVTEDLTRLQARRAIARGLLPTPTLPAIPAELKRPLSAFPELARTLGPGEVGLSEETASTLLIHEGGRFVNSIVIDALPPIALAIENPPSLPQVQPLAVSLVAKIIEAGAPLPAKIYKHLAHAYLAGRLTATDLGVFPVFVTQDGSRVAVSVLEQQLAKFGNVWAITSPTDDRPIDRERMVFAFDDDDIAVAKQRDLSIVEAAPELALDAIRRRNRKRAPAVSLELPASYGVLAQVTLDGDGVKLVRGVVGVLEPDAADARGIYPHKAMHPLDRGDDPCRWPTIAVVDDARIEPDRTWSAPQHDDVWQSIGKAVREASERALEAAVAPPPDALASWRINNFACADVQALRRAPKSVIRGMLWLRGTPLDALLVGVSAREQRAYTPLQVRGLAGWLLIYAPDGLDVDLALDQLITSVHGKLVRALLKTDLHDDLVAAHVAHALALGTLRPTDARTVKLTCFSPRSLDARGVATLLHGSDPVHVIAANAVPDPDPEVIELVDNRSLQSRVILQHLGERARRARSVRRPAPVTVSPPPPTTTPPPSPSPRPQPAPRSEEPPHPLAALKDLLAQRIVELGLGRYDWVILERSTPMFAYEQAVFVAGDNPRLRALAAALAANSPFAPAGVDVVVAHLATVLNRALTQITDASEAHALGVLLAQSCSDRT